MSTLGPESQQIISESLANLENDIKANEPLPEPGNETNMFHMHQKRGARQIFKQLSADVLAEVGGISKKMSDWPLHEKGVSNEDYEKILRGYLDELMPIFVARVKNIANLIGLLILPV